MDLFLPTPRVASNIDVLVCNSLNKITNGAGFLGENVIAVMQELTNPDTNTGGIICNRHSGIGIVRI